MQALTIGRAARAAGVNTETVRFYERRGLIEQPPKGDGYRVYSAEQVARIRFIKEAQQIGFTLSEITELLTLRADPSADCSDVRKQAVAKLNEVRRKIAQLQKVGDALGALIAACPRRGALQACSIMDALTARSAPGAAQEKTLRSRSRNVSSRSLK
jgi:Hg(II)-responsive transcriptional regulator